jgi:hypothetical protein
MEQGYDGAAARLGKRLRNIGQMVISSDWKQPTAVGKNSTLPRMVGAPAGWG